MAKYVRTSKRLQRIQWIEELIGDYEELLQLEKMFCCFAFCLHFKKARRSRNYTLTSLSLGDRPVWRSKTC
jgi:hypothetical protein